MDGCTSSSGRAYFRFLFALLSFLFPVALGLRLDPDVLLTVAFWRAAWNCCTMAAALPFGISTADGDVARRDAMLTMGDFCPSWSEVGAGTALGELQPSDQSVSNSTMSWWCLCLAISSGVMSKKSATFLLAKFTKRCLTVSALPSRQPRNNGVWP